MIRNTLQNCLPIALNDFVIFLRRRTQKAKAVKKATEPEKTELIDVSTLSLSRFLFDESFLIGMSVHFSHNETFVFKITFSKPTAYGFASTCWLQMCATGNRCSKGNEN